MEIKRTANAGVLLRLDGKRILMDGVCREVKPYLATPPHVRRELLDNPPDALLFTHNHADHYDAAFVSDYLQKTAGPVMGPADIPFSSGKTLDLGGVRITQIPSKHVGKWGDVGHVSFILEGTRCVWFLGDASPLQWKEKPTLPKADVVIAPYAYGMGNGWKILEQLGARDVVLLHLPEPDTDPYGLWAAVEESAAQRGDRNMYIPCMEETIKI
jgi:L-ascorbate metabolism protein UlaG (beta-lactamase superfamily)